MNSVVFSPRTLESIYRFALLLTGDAETASGAVMEVLREGLATAAQFRNDRHRNACLVMKLRELCLKREMRGKPEDEPEAEGSQEEAHYGEAMAASFRRMREPNRSALALFYLDLFPPAELAQLFRMKADDLADALADGRDFLRGQLAGFHA